MRDSQSGDRYGQKKDMESLGLSQTVVVEAPDGQMNHKRMLCADGVAFSVESNGVRFFGVDSKVQSVIVDIQDTGLCYWIVVDLMG